MVGCMRFQHRCFEQEGHRLHELIDRTSGFRIQVDSLGAELISIARHRPDQTWDGYLYRDGVISAPAEGWKNHATVMGYYIHRLKGERTLYAGDEIRGGNHSFIRYKHFSDPEVLVSENATLSYFLASDQIQPSEYPRKVSMRLNYTLTDDCLDVVFVFQNEEADRPAHVSFGLHPGFSVSSLENARVILPTGSYRRYLAPGNFLSGETRMFESPGGPMSFKPFELPDSFLLEAVDVEDHVVRLLDFSSGREVQIDLSEVPFFTLWSDLRPFICIEPCWGLPDHQNQEPFEKKLGMQVIPAKGTLTRRCSMRFR
jgi:galactose mutarotase-like enzyme